MGVEAICPHPDFINDDDDDDDDEDSC